MQHSRSANRIPFRPRRVGAVIAAVAAAGLAVAGLTPAQAAPRPNAPAASGARYVVAHRSCASAARGVATCFAIRLEAATRSTPGAVRLPARSSAPAGDGASSLYGPSGYDGYTPAALASAYGVNPDGGAGVTVAIVDAFNDPTVRADLNHFDKYYGIPQETSTSFRVVNHNGATSPLPRSDPDWADEITLDVQAVRGLCRACRIVLVEASDANDYELGRSVDTAVRMGATIVSNSYGVLEYPRSTAELARYRADYDHKGVAVVASTGDDGWYGWDYVNDNNDPSDADQAPSTPATLPTVVAVGGTALVPDNPSSDSTTFKEVSWNENGNANSTVRSTGGGASGGGCSKYFTAQPWQSSVNTWASMGCTGNKRLAADVSADADQFTGMDLYQSYGNDNGGPSWEAIGGTSLAAPLISAVWALAGGPGGVSYPSQSLYGSYKYRSASFHDVVPRTLDPASDGGAYFGGNGFCAGWSQSTCSSSIGGGNPNTNIGARVDCEWKTDGTPVSAVGQCVTGTGYDGPTGVGTPDGVNGFKPLITFAATGSATTVKLNHALTISTANFADIATGGTFNRTTIDWGDGTTTIASSTSQRHSYKKKGSYKVLVAVVDNYGYMARHAVYVTAAT